METHQIRFAFWTKCVGLVGTHQPRRDPSDSCGRPCFHTSATTPPPDARRPSPSVIIPSFHNSISPRVRVSPPSTTTRTNTISPQLSRTRLCRTQYADSALPARGSTLIFLQIFVRYLYVYDTPNHYHQPHTRRGQYSTRPRKASQWLSIDQIRKPTVLSDRRT